MPDFSRWTPAQAALVAALVAALIGILTLLQKWGADRRASWWQRTQWAINLTLEIRASDPADLSDNELDKLIIAQATLDALQQEGGVRPSDYDVVTRALERIERLVQGEPTDEVDTNAVQEEDDA